MPYSTTAQVQTAVGGSDTLIQLSDFDNTGVLVQSTVDDAITQADALIKSYAGKRYRPDQLAAGIEIGPLSARIAARIMRSNRGQQRMSDADDEKFDRQWLEDLRDGKVTLSTDNATPAAADMVVDKAEVRESTKSVSRERLKGFW